MRTPSRKLGRGLGAFLDFGPAEGDGAARVSDALGGKERTSVLETSAPAPPKPAPPLAPAPKPIARPAPAPALPVVAAPPPPPAPVANDSPFIDDEVVGLTFPDVELE